jgi:hypothetical protein
LYKRNAGFSSKDEHLTSNELYGILKVCASKPCTTLILAVTCNAKKILQSLKSVLKKPTLGQAHLFFANAQSQRLKK